MDSEHVCSIDDPRVRGVLDRLYAEQKKQVPALLRLSLMDIRDKILSRRISDWHG